MIRSNTESKNSQLNLRVDVMGSSYWVQVVCNLLKRAGLYAEAIDPHGKFSLLKWALRGQWRRFDVIHLTSGVWEWKAALIFMLVPRPAIWHWIGTDILNFQRNSQKGWKGLIIRLAAYRKAKAHLADSPELAEELGKLGIKADVVRLLPEQIEAKVEPLPEEFAALSYWSDGRTDFYGGNIVFELAKEFPNVKFRVVGATGENEKASPNVEFLGFQKDLSKIYSMSSVFIRMPEHDSLSAMVLEMLARGRYVIYNKKLQGCHFAHNMSEAREILRLIIKKTTPNIDGAEMVKESFSLDIEAGKLNRIYVNLFNSGHRRT
jgi:glycosyltransferase involved in cell wall biosynthesis